MRVIYDYLVDSFVDFDDKIHNFVICCRTESLDDSFIEFSSEQKSTNAPCEKILSLGIAVSNPDDNFDLEFGKKLAKGRSDIFVDRMFFVTKRGMIQKDLVKNLMRQEADFIKRNPESVVPGYDEAKDRYDLHAKMTNDLNNLNEDEKLFMKIIDKVDINKLIKLNEYTKR